MGYLRFYDDEKTNSIIDNIEENIKDLNKKGYDYSINLIWFCISEKKLMI